MNTQPEASLLADYLDMAHIGQHKSAAELRRLHEVNTTLLKALQAALDALRGSAGFDEINNAKKQVKAAIAKATGEKV
jgi:hypothetical protein